MRFLFFARRPPQLQIAFFTFPRRSAVAPPLLCTVGAAIANYPLTKRESLSSGSPTNSSPLEPRIAENRCV
jgi:hypothetical protein